MDEISELFTSTFAHLDECLTKVLASHRYALEAKEYAEEANEIAKDIGEVADKLSKRKELFNWN